MAQLGWIFDKSKCVGCRACVVACQMENNAQADVHWRWVMDLESGAYPNPVLTFFSTACYHCVHPACMPACPVDAITKDPATGLVEIMADDCIGCTYCMATCPYGAPQLNKATAKVEKCHGCVQRVTEGLMPACVDTCVGGALQWVADEAWGGSGPDEFAPANLTQPAVKFES